MADKSLTLRDDQGAEVTVNIAGETVAISTNLANDPSAKVSLSTEQGEQLLDFMNEALTGEGEPEEEEEEQAEEGEETEQRA